MKNTKFMIIIVVCVCVILGGYYYLTNRNNAKEEENITLTEIQELTTKNLDKNFPATPREVVKLYSHNPGAGEDRGGGRRVCGYGAGADSGGYPGSGRCVPYE